jgi:hypothetical protein
MSLLWPAPRQSRPHKRVYSDWPAQLDRLLCIITVRQSSGVGIPRHWRYPLIEETIFCADPMRWLCRWVRLWISRVRVRISDSRNVISDFSVTCWIAGFGSDLECLRFRSRKHVADGLCRAMERMKVNNGRPPKQSPLILVLPQDRGTRTTRED